MDICNPSGADLPGGPYNLIVATLALHTLVGHQAQDEERIRTRSSFQNNQGISSLLKVQGGAGGTAEGVGARRSPYHWRPCGDVGALQVEM